MQKTKKIKQIIFYKSYFEKEQNYPEKNIHITLNKYKEK